MMGRYDEKQCKVNANFLLNTTFYINNCKNMRRFRFFSIILQAEFEDKTTFIYEKIDMRRSFRGHSGFFVCTGYE